MDIHELPCRIKSARTKKRLVKTDRDKQLIELSKRRMQLYEQRSALPMVPLEFPYQKGWKRFFVLRGDITHSLRNYFYSELLEKINTFEFHHDRSFKRKKRRKGRYGYEIKKQSLRELTPYLWESGKLNLSEQEKACFTQVETYNIRTRQLEIRYVFAEPWRYTLKDAPHIITHRKLLDSDIEQELDRINQYMRMYGLEPRTHLLTNGRGYRNGWYALPLKYSNSRKKIPKYRSIETYLDLDF